LNENLRRAAGLAGALLVVGLVAACGPRGTGPQAQPGWTTFPAVPSTSTSLAPTADATASADASPLPTYDPGTTIDAVDSDLQTLTQILNGLDGSVSGSDPGANGGE
jgi:hypothetical protein